MHFRCISVPHLVTEAGGDPWAVDASLQVGRPAQIDVLAQAFHTAGRCSTDASNAFDEARRRFQAAWNGESGTHPINDSAEVQRVTNDLGSQYAQLSQIGVELEGLAAALAEAQRASADSLAALEARLQQIDYELAEAMALGTGETFVDADLSALDALVSALEHDAIERATSTLNHLLAIRAEYSKHLRKSLTYLRTDGYNPAAIEPVEALANSPEPTPLPPSGSGPEGVNRWWKSLTQQEKERLIADHPPALGNLNGIPTETRNRINTAVLNDDLHRVEDTATGHGITTNDVIRNPGAYGLTATAVTRYTNARRTREGVATSGTAADGQRNHPDVFLLRYEPEAFGGEGAAAIAMGNPDTAANTALLVSGLGSNVRDGTLADLGGVRVYGESARADWNKKTAVVVWMGYDAPDTWHDPGLWAPNMARTGGQSLAADVNALAVTHVGTPSHVTVLGNSYGSTTVADAAAAYGMHADDVVLVGSPGTDLARSAADFHLRPGGHLYVGASSTDPVTWSPDHVTGPGLIGPTLGGLGADPAVDGYGSTRFRAEAPGASINPVSDHLRYFDDGSESLFSIADVVSGHGDALQHDGMTAHHRGEYGFDHWIDPEAVRAATTGHRHRSPAD